VVQVLIVEIVQMVDKMFVKTNVGSIVSLDWQSSAEGETILQHFYDPQTTGRKVLGICFV
jgi:hypothetical protein